VGRWFRVLLGLALFAGAIVVGLYGLFAVLYQGDSGGNGDTYVKMGGRDIDSQLVGVSSLILAAGMLLAGWLAIRRRSI
jgi:hypothetical protein